MAEPTEVSATWQTVDEQPLDDWLLPHERADIERSATIEGFVSRAELDLETADGKHSREARNRRLSRARRRA